jgi:hypothetical protein
MPTLGRNAPVAATVLLVASARDGLAQDPLAGVRAVGVFVEKLAPDAARISLTEDDLRTKVELKLRMAGLRVVPPPAATIPSLDVQVTVKAGTGPAEGLYVHDVQLTLYEFVELPRTKKLVPGELWSDGSIGYVGVNNARESILGDVDRKVDSFLNAWLAANPK